MCFIVWYTHHVLDIDIVVISVRRVVTYGVHCTVYNLIDVLYSRVQTRQPTRRSMLEVTVLKIQAGEEDSSIGVGMDSWLESSR